MGTTRNVRARRKKMEDRSDRMSGLPDHLLVSILSLLPLKSAIVTDVLSKRWRGLWTHSPVIDFSIDKHDDEFYNIIENLLSKFSSPIIDRFSLALNRCQYSTDTFYNERSRNYSYIASWFDWASLRGDKQVHEFRFIICDGFFYLRQMYPDTPLCVFQMSSLDIHELRPWLFLHSDYDDNNSMFDLPNLKKVRVQLHSSNTKVLEKLISNSPSLEDLSFTLCFLEIKYLSINLTSTSVKRLDMNLNYPINVVINAPSIEYLGITLYFFNELHYRISFVNAPTALLDCSTCAHSFYQHDMLQPSAFNSAISNVISLTVTDEKPGPLLAATTFRNLTHLTL